MDRQETKLETIVVTGCIFACGYILLILALFLDNLTIFISGAVVFLLSVLSIQKFDPVVRRSCATSGLVHLLWIGFVGACIFWDATLMVRVILFSLSPAAHLIAQLVSGTSRELRAVLVRSRRAYRQIQRQSRDL